MVNMQPAGMIKRYKFIEILVCIDANQKVSTRIYLRSLSCA